MPAPVTARGQLLTRVDDDLGPAARALQGDDGADRAVDVCRPGPDDRAAQGGEILVARRLLEQALGPLVPAEQADQLPCRRTQLDVGGPAPRAPVDAVGQVGVLSAELLWLLGMLRIRQLGWQ